ncbi:MAG: hypothetical protein JWO54_902 [Candidatus Saccharibacteria bacterium]|nr:hypothetical protein [Candidatus Saccharibacteria bacterium]
MFSSLGLRFVPVISQTFKTAKGVESLKLQDRVAAGFKNPLEDADPSNTKLVLKQLWRHIRHPERYSGYTLNGQLIAFMVQNYWSAGDEEPYKGPEPINQWGIFGLVASDELDKDIREYVLESLLVYSFKDPESGEPRTVNISIYEQDPLLKIALRHGFVPVGEKAEAAGAPGLLQHRYQRPASH